MYHNFTSLNRVYFEMRWHTNGLRILFLLITFPCSDPILVFLFFVFCMVFVQLCSFLWVGVESIYLCCRVWMWMYLPLALFFVNATIRKSLVTLSLMQTIAPTNSKIPYLVETFRAKFSPCMFLSLLPFLFLETWRLGLLLFPNFFSCLFCPSLGFLGLISSSLFFEEASYSFLSWPPLDKSLSHIEISSSLW